jgi:hypothetical protein
MKFMLKNDKVALVGQSGEGRRKPETFLGTVIQFGAGAVVATSVMVGSAIALVLAVQKQEEKRAKRQGR